VRYQPVGLFASVLLVISSACTHSPPEGSSPDSRVITEAEIVESRAITAYDAIQKLRANFLTNRGKVTIRGSASPLPVIFLDGIEYGPMESLRSIPAAHVSKIRLYRASEAAPKFGTTRTGGVIEVLTKM
jgi:outer membrane cobalamin receptor